MQRDAIIDLMNDPVAQELVKAPIHARLAYCARDGSPRVVPIGYTWNGEVFVMGSPVNAPKVKALAVNPKVALTVDTDTLTLAATKLMWIAICMFFVKPHCFKKLVNLCHTLLSRLS